LRVVIPTEGDDGPGADLTISLATMARLATSFGAAHPMSIAIDQGRRQHPALTPLAGGIKRALDPDDLCNRLAAVAAVPTPLPA